METRAEEIMVVLLVLRRENQIQPDIEALLNLLAITTEALNNAKLTFPCSQSSYNSVLDIPVLEYD